MLEILRKGAHTWIAKLLLMLLVVSFGVWGISGSLINGTDNTVVSVGNTKVDIFEYRFAYDQQVNRLSQQFGRRLNRDEARSFGIEQIVMSQMVTGAILDSNAQKMGLGISNDDLAKLIAEDPAFQDASGTYSRARVDQVLRDAGLTPQDYIENRKAVAIRNQLVDGISANLVMPEVFDKAATLFQNQERSITYVVLGKGDVEAPADPGEEVLKKFYEDNKKRYRAPEYRKVEFVKLTAEDLADPAAVTEDEIKKDYEANKAKYTVAEKRTIEQLVFKDKEAAEKAEAELKGGKSFADIAKEQGKTEKDITLGAFAKKDLPDQKLADAAFGLEEGKPSEIIQGLFGPVIVMVTKIEPSKVTPLDEVKDEIRKGLALQGAENTGFDAHDTFEDELAAGATLKEAADKAGLKLTTIDAIDRNGLDKNAKPITGLPQSAELIAGAFEANEGEENAPINIGAAGFIWYGVAGIEDERQKEFAEVKDQVLADWTQDETLTRIKAKADTFAERVKKGEDFAALASELLSAAPAPMADEDNKPADETEAGETPEAATDDTSRVKTAKNIKRSDAGNNLSRNVVATMFDMVKGDVDVANGKDANQMVVLRLDEVSPGSDVLSDGKVLERFNDALQDDVLAEMVGTLRERSEIRINQQAAKNALAM